MDNVQSVCKTRTIQFRDKKGVFIGCDNTNNITLNYIMKK